MKRKFCFGKTVKTVGIEYFTFLNTKRSFVMDGTVIMILENLPTKVNYRVECMMNGGRNRFVSFKNAME
jgi:hypothetical protein